MSPESPHFSCSFSPCHRRGRFIVVHPNRSLYPRSSLRISASHFAASMRVDELEVVTEKRRKKQTKKHSDGCNTHLCPWGYDMKNQVITTNCWLNQIWTDFGLQWDPDKYGGIKVIRLPHDEVWRPDILLYNNADVSSFFSSISTNVIVTADGNVTWLSMVIFKSSCPIDVQLLHALRVVDLRRVQHQPHHQLPGGRHLQLHPNSEWQLVYLRVERNVKVYSCCAEPYPDITCHILIRRRPLFYIFNMILPCILITLVALLGFYIPSDSGEKVTMGITTLLSMTVFMMLDGDGGG
ncbi:hypothetical protein C0Q70_09841 [Pomacea canaliculata]|uniref:Neurotransmitter-gated ion-channel ligand-binding domain-containing protein n=1 Tax=Pomacea canaliculata TaxID=400727 RepID=A0A2T7PAX5_POMCA|nr:hypothetical protein C0Q70_09841 [Pomacea canaliculata]